MDVLLMTGGLTSDSFVCKPGMPGWIQVREAPELSANIYGSTLLTKEDMHEVAARTKEFFSPQSVNKTNAKVDSVQGRKDRLKEIAESNLQGQETNRSVSKPNEVPKVSAPVDAIRGTPAQDKASKTDGTGPKLSTKPVEAPSQVSNEEDDSESEDVIILPGISLKQMMKQALSGTEGQTPQGPQPGEIQKQVGVEEKLQLTEAELVECHAHLEAKEEGEETPKEQGEEKAEVVRI